MCIDVIYLVSSSINAEFHTHHPIASWHKLMMSMDVMCEFNDGVVVRPAKREDKAAVNTIRVYNGLDYLEHMYDHYMDNPNYYCFLAEKQNKVVSNWEKLLEKAQRKWSSQETPWNRELCTSKCKLNCNWKSNFDKFIPLEHGVNNFYVINDNCNMKRIYSLMIDRHKRSFGI